MATFKIELERPMRYYAFAKIEADTLDEAMEKAEGMSDTLNWGLDEWSSEGRIIWVSDEQDACLWNEDADTSADCEPPGQNGPVASAATVCGGQGGH